ncbi:MAG: acyl-CoA dehydrogenase C-terminal domain-containing protein [Pseudomonadota bacterium]
MANYTPPLRDIGFVLHEVLRVQDRSDVAGYDELTEDLTGQILEEAGKLARDVLAPLNAVGDRQGCRLENGVVRTPDGFKEAWAQLVDGGWPSLECATEYGGQGMPSVLNIQIGTMKSAANMAFMMYSGLTHGAYSALRDHGSDEQKQRYLPKLVSGEWTGTMNLTEPQCGTDLGLIRTKAEPAGDGSFRITGQKIYISAGEHDMAENIIHLVLARLPDAPEGTKGISLFVVPKFLVHDDGSLGQRNPVACGKVEEKMGIHGSATCVMHYDGATGWLVGEAHKGLRAMFTMMNEARLLVGMQGLAIAQGAYQLAAEYAKDRVQGRAVTGAEAPDKPADPLIVHPDVRRLLLDQKAFVEGGMAFLAEMCMALDLERRHEDEDERKRAGERVALLTPVVKAHLTEEGYRLTSNAMQVFGGHGYIEEYGIAQFMRDARITMIYEGATGVQALDLVGRKLGAGSGRAIMAYFEDIKAFCAANKANEALEKDFLGPLKQASKDLQAAAMYFMQAGAKNPNAALAGSVDFVHLFGHVGIGLAWARMAKAAHERLEAIAAGAEGDADYYRNKLITGRYYMSRVLPETGLRLARIQSGAEPVMDLPAEAF